MSSQQEPQLDTPCEGVLQTPLEQNDSFNQPMISDPITEDSKMICQFKDKEPLKLCEANQEPLNPAELSMDEQSSNKKSSQPLTDNMSPFPDAGFNKVIHSSKLGGDYKDLSNSSATTSTPSTILPVPQQTGKDQDKRSTRSSIKKSNGPSPRKDDIYEYSKEEKPDQKGKTSRRKARQDNGQKFNPQISKRISDFKNITGQFMGFDWNIRELNMNPKQLPSILDRVMQMTILNNQEVCGLYEEDEYKDTEQYHGIIKHLLTRDQDQTKKFIDLWQELKEEYQIKEIMNAEDTSGPIQNIVDIEKVLKRADELLIETTEDNLKLTKEIYTKVQVAFEPSDQPMLYSQVEGEGREQLLKSSEMASYNDSIYTHVDENYKKEIQELKQQKTTEELDNILMDNTLPNIIEDIYVNYIQDKKKITETADEDTQEEEGTKQKRQEVQLPLIRQRQVRAIREDQDAKCMICTSGDYEDNDLIVFCEMCNTPVHQLCYGIDSLSDEDWICQSCKIFTKEENLKLQCYLCPQLGGPMRPTWITLQNNDPLSESYQPTMFNNDISEWKKLKKQGKSIFCEERIPNFSSLQKKEQDFKCDHQLDHTPTYFAWVHMSCAQWIPEIQCSSKIGIKLNKIDERRFGKPCVICKTSIGATVSCCTNYQCQKTFHVECARRSMYCMEKPKKVFCERHRPLKLLRDKEEKNRVILDDISIFSNLVYKCLEILDKMKDRTKSNKGSDRRWREKDRKALLQRVKEVFLDCHKLKIPIIKQRKRIMKEDSKDEYKVDKMVPFYSTDWQITMNWKGFPWKHVASYMNTFRPGNEYKASECFTMYKQLIENQDNFIKRVLGERFYWMKFNTAVNTKRNKSKKKGMVNSIFGIIGFHPKAPSNEFCICQGQQGKDIDDFFIGCDGGEDICPYNGWFHKKCVDELRNMKVDEADQMQSWYCNECRLNKDEDEQPQMSNDIEIALQKGDCFEIEADQSLGSAPTVLGPRNN